MVNCTLAKQLHVANQLGEGVIWDPLCECIWWVDILRSKLFQSDLNGNISTYNTPEPLCSFGLTNYQGVFIAAFASGFYWYKPHSNHRQLITKVEQELPANRLNDGRVDRQGRFWAGGMRLHGEGQLTGLYQLTPDGAIKRKNHIQISNSLCWSLDSKFVYHADSPKCVIERAEFDPQTGDLGSWVNWVDIKAGAPDGACVDSHNCVWVAIWGAARINRYSPEGDLVFSLKLPCKQPTCVTFAGPQLNYLVVTSARVDIQQEQLETFPANGDVFIYKTDVEGLLESVCTKPITEQQNEYLVNNAHNQ